MKSCYGAMTKPKTDFRLNNLLVITFTILSTYFSNPPKCQIARECTAKESCCLLPSVVVR